MVTITKAGGIIIMTVLWNDIINYDDIGTWRIINGQLMNNGIMWRNSEQY